MTDLGSAHTKKIKALILLGPQDLQRGSGKFLQSPKTHDLFLALESEQWITPEVRLHVESQGPMYSAYSFHALHRLADLMQLGAILMRLLTRFVFRKATLLRSPVTDSRELWSQARELFWKQKLSVLRIDFLMGVGLTKEEMRAAKSLKIPTMEVQHGLFDESTMRSYWPVTYPDFFAIWPISDHQGVSDFGPEPITIPHPGLRPIYSEEDSGDAPLLVVLSWKDPTAVGPHGAIPRDVWAAIPLASTQANKLTFRFHPVFKKRWRKPLEKFIVSEYPDALFEDPLLVPIENSLTASKGVLTAGSTVWMEAALLGVPIYAANHETYVAAMELPCLPGVNLHAAFLEPSIMEKSKNVRLGPKVNGLNWEGLIAIVLPNKKGPE